MVAEDRGEKGSESIIPEKKVVDYLLAVRQKIEASFRNTDIKYFTIVHSTSQPPWFLHTFTTNYHALLLLLLCHFLPKMLRVTVVVDI